MVRLSALSYCSRLSALSDGCANALQSLSLKRLPLGAVQPKGWLEHQLVLMKDGITGRLPEYGPYFKEDRNGFLYPDTPKGWEEVPYWLRGFYPLAVLLDDGKMLAQAQQYLEAIFSSADEDGWFGPAYLKDRDKSESGTAIPDTFPNAILGDVLALYYDSTGDERVLSLLKNYIRFLLSVPEDAFLPKRPKRLQWQKVRAGDHLSWLYWYYDTTGDSNALVLSERVHKKIWKTTTEFVANHAVDFAQRFAYDGIYFRQSQNKEDFERSEHYYQHTAEMWGQLPRGLFAADERFRAGENDPRQAFEPCAMVELQKNFMELLRISGDTKYADRTEDIMLNHFTASFTPDYKQMHYLTAANSPMLSDYRYAATYNGTKSHDRSYFIMTPNNRCCGHNSGMGWTWYSMNLWQETADGGLAAVLYASSHLKAEIGGRVVELETKTNYPFSGDVSAQILSEGKFPLYFRIPAWSKGCKVRINGEEKVFRENSGWICVEKAWAANDSIDISFTMELGITLWKNNGSVSVDYGPLSYSLKIAEEYRILEDAGAYNHPEPHLWENYEVLPGSPWNYGLVSGEDIHIVKQDANIADQPWIQENAPIVLKAKAKKIPNWTIQDDCAAKLQQSPVYSEEATEEVELIPLGCARLRIGCFPVVTDDPGANRWEKIPVHIPLEERTDIIPFDETFDMNAAAAIG